MKSWPDGCLRAVEHLRLVFAELHAVTIRETVSFHSAHGSFDADGKPLDKHGSQEAAAKMLHQLSWWARGASPGPDERAVPGLTTNYRLSRECREPAVVVLGDRRPDEYEPCPGRAASLRLCRGHS